MRSSPGAAVSPLPMEPACCPTDCWLSCERPQAPGSAKHRRWRTRLPREPSTDAGHDSAGARIPRRPPLPNRYAFQFERCAARGRDGRPKGLRYERDEVPPPCLPLGLASRRSAGRASAGSWPASVRPRARRRQSVNASASAPRLAPPFRHCRWSQLVAQLIVGCRANNPRRRAHRSTDAGGRVYRASRLRTQDTTRGRAYTRREATVTSIRRRRRGRVRRQTLGPAGCGAAS